MSVNYGQRHARELDAAAQFAEQYRVAHVVLDMSNWGAQLAGSALTDPSVAVPHGHYEAESMRVTVVPNRNATFLMAAVGVAQARGLSRVLIAVHAGDHAIYPDCRPSFIAAVSQAALLGTDGAVAIEAPFLTHTKTQIANFAAALDVPIARTWSCYEGGFVHCGRCGTCVERREALREAGIPDPTVYRG